LAPHWPDPAVQQQMHLGLAEDDLDAGHERALAPVPATPGTQEKFRACADPVGHPFCRCSC
jgi:Glyoxalase-like domain